MPELPEAETIARGLAKCMKRKTVTGAKTSSLRLRGEIDIKKIRRLAIGKKVRDVGRRGKAVIIRLSSGICIMIQLGMSGICRVDKKGEPAQKHDHFSLELSGGLSLHFNDARRFGMVMVYEEKAQDSWPKFLKTLGPEPLSKSFSGELLFAKTRGRKVAVKQLILDQQVVAGIGNIYASEILFRAKVNPLRPCGKLKAKECEMIATKTKEVLYEAIKAGGTTISDYRLVDGSEGNFETNLRVYGREGEPCPVCSRKIGKTILGGRSTFYCPACQK